jgi:hypothetical protein
LIRWLVRKILLAFLLNVWPGTLSFSTCYGRGL